MEYEIKSGNCFKLVPYKHHYMIVTDEHFGTVQYHIVNLESGIVTCTCENVKKVEDFLVKWKAMPTTVILQDLE